MKKRITAVKIISGIIVLTQVLGVVTFSILYFAFPALKLSSIIKIEWLLLGLAGLLFIDLIYIWIISSLIGTLRHKTDLRAAEVIGNDVQEAYNFAMIGLAVTDNNDNVIWTNDLFKTRHIDIIDTNILDWNPSLSVLKETSNYSGDKSTKIKFNSRTYEVKFLIEAGLWIFKDITDYEEVFNYSKDQAPVLGVLAIDNYDDVVRGDDDFNDVATKVKNVIFNYAKEYGVLLRRIKDDSYSMLCNYENYCRMNADHFSFIDKVREVCRGLDVPLTLSVGLAREFPDVIKLNELANEALDIAMSRGGDQVVVSVYGSEMEFYGGKSEAQEKRTRVKDRVLSDSIMALIKASSNVIVMGHAEMDLDAFGACLGFKAICNHLNKDCRVVVDFRSTEYKTRAAINSSFSKEELDRLIISPKDADSLINTNTLLAVLDVHTDNMVMAPKLLEKSSKILVIDHHRRAEDYIEGPVFNHIDPAASSTCEIIAEFIKFSSLNPRIIIPSMYSTFMLAGIYLDTHYFKSKTTVRTFEACTILKEFGADNAMADDFLKDDYEEYQLINTMISKLDHPSYGVVCAYASEDRIFDRASLAKAANTLLSFKGNHASFVAGKISNNAIGVSARSDGSINVSFLFEKIGGGGQFSRAAVVFEKSSMADVKEALTNVIDTYLEEATNRDNKLKDEGDDD
ncbi:MAG: DHH family phosphoesterase [Bacilli bacterium]|nr:DHH family phosphoesterase [Bacilli bacterium]